MFMLNCSVKGSYISASALEHGLEHSPAWRDDIDFARYIADTFPLPNGDAISSSDTKAKVMVRKLQKLAGLQFQPTDYLRNHLKLEHRTGIVYIFHHTTFLEEHLRLTRDSPRDMSVVDTLKRGALPRHLILEVLDSIQKIILPLTDES